MKKEILYSFIVLLTIVNGMLIAIVWQEFSDTNEVKKVSKAEMIVTPVVEKNPFHKYSIYLTSDDGPLVGSEFLNEIILQEEVPISVFLVGQHDKGEFSDKLVAYRNNKHVLIANHSFSHAHARYKRFYANSENVVNDFLKNEYVLNIESRVGRLAGRNIWAINGSYYGKGTALKSAKILEKQFSYSIYGWDYEIRHNDNGKVLGSAKKSYARIKWLLENNKTYVQNKIVILMHDQMFRVKKSRRFLEELIVLFKGDKDCKFEFINNYLTI